MANELIKYITAQDIQPQSKALQGVNLPEQIDMTNNAYEQVRQNVHVAYEQVRKAMAARTQAFQAEAEARGRRGVGAQLTGIANTIQEGIQIHNKLLEEQAKKAKDQLDSVYERDAALAKIAIQEQLLQMDGRIRESGQQAGVDTTRQAVERILNVDYAHLPPDIRAKLEDVFYSPLMEEEHRMTSRMFEEATQNRNDSEAQRTALIRLSVVNELTALHNPQNSPETASAIVGSILQRATELTPDMPPERRAAVITPVISSIIENYQTGEESRQVLIRTLNGMNGFAQAMQQAQESGLLQNPNQAMIVATHYATQFGVPQLANNWMTEDQLLSRAVEYQNNVQHLQELQFDAQNRQLAQQAPGYLADSATTLAWNWMNSTSPNAAVQRAYAQAHPDRVTEPERLAAALYENWTKYQQQYHELNDQISQDLQWEAQAAVRRDPSQLPPSTLFLDTTSGRYRRAEISGEDMAVFLAPQISAEQYQATVQRVLNRQQQLQELVQRGLREGIDLTNIGNPAPIEVFRNRMAAVESEQRAIPPRADNPPSPFPNFNFGGSPTRYAGLPPVQALARTPTNMVLPIAANHRATITSGYGNRRHPIYGDTRFHSGLDIAPLDGRDVGAVSISAGQVIAARDWTGYGGTVMVRTADGHVEQYSHLRRFFVNVGDTIPAGAPVGLIGGGRGDRMSGGSTGRHLHFQVWRPGTTEFVNPQQNTSDPTQYLQGIHYTEPVARNGLGLPPTQPLGERQLASPATMPAVGGSWLTAFLGFTPPWLSRPGSPVVTPSEHVFTPTNPIPSVHAPIQRSAYPRRNNPRANYGYRAIANDPQFAHALAALGDDFNFPAQWLADIMATESTTNFSPNIENGIGAIGLIQAIPPTYRALGLTRDQMLRMSRTEYLQRVVRPYLEEFRGKINTVEDLLAAIFGGGRLHRMSPERRASASDGNISFANYARQLGSSVGRRYRTSYDRTVPTGQPHTTPQPGCPICQAQIARFQTIVPHLPN